MAAVYDIPAYENQTINKVNSHVCLATVKANLPKINGYPYLGMGAKDLQRNVMGNHPLNCPVNLDNESPKSVMLKGMFDCTRNITSFQELAVHGRFGNYMAEILSSKETWCHDAAAVQHIMALSMSQKINYTPTEKTRYRWQRIDEILKRTGTFLAMASDQGEKWVKKSMKVVDVMSAGQAWLTQGRAFSEWAEKLMIQSTSLRGNAATLKVRSDGKDVVLDDFTINTTHGVSVNRLEVVYKIQGVYFILYDTFGAILDRAHVAHLATCAGRLRDARNAAVIRRVSGISEDETHHYCTAFMSIEAEIASRYASTFPLANDLVAKSMKTAQSMLVNNFHSQDDYYDTGVEARNKELRDGYMERNDGGVCWYDFMIGLRVTNRDLIDLSNMYHMLPPPDACPYLLFKKTYETMSEPNPVDMTAWHDFMNYCKVADVAKAAYGSNEQLKLRVVPQGTKALDEELKRETEKWLAYARKNSGYLPPRHLWGKFYLYRHYEYKKVEEVAYLCANDVTHVMPDLTQYEGIQPSDRDQSIEKNELLYTLRYGKMLAKRYTPEEARNLLISGRYDLPKIAEIAAKSENTKDKLKARETFSGDGVMREIISSIDQSAIPLASDWPSVCLRRNERGYQRTLNNFVHATRVSERGSCVLYSLDVQQWSPKMPRICLYDHHQYVLETTCSPDGLNIRKVLSGIEIAINKRGIYTHVPLEEGDFQGWFGTMNSVLHAHIQSYCIRKLKEMKILDKSSNGESMVMIDDAVLKINFPRSMRPEARQEAAGKIATAIQQIYASLGFNLSMDKTVISTHMFIFLNRYFSGGAEFALPLKVSMKLSRDTKKRFASTCDQMDEIFNTGRGALVKGSDPHVTYMQCMRNCLDLALQTNPDVGGFSDFEAALVIISPRDLGGWGLPTFAEFCSKESTDSMTRAIALFQTVARQVTHFDNPITETLAQFYATSYTAFLSTDFRRPNVWSFLAAPQSVCLDSVQDATSGLRVALKANLDKMGVCPEVRLAINLDSDPRVDELMWNILFNIKADVAVFEILGGVRPLAAYSNLMKKLITSEVLATLVPRHILQRVTRRIRVLDRNNMVALINRIRTANLANDWRMIYSEICEAPLCKQVHDYRKLFYRFIGVRVLNHSDPDPVEVVCQVNREQEIIMTCHYKPPITTSRDLIRDENPSAAVWNSPGSDYANMYDGTARVGRRDPPSSKSAYASDDPIAKSLPPLVKELARFGALCTYLEKRGLPGNILWDIGMAINGILDTVLVSIAGIDIVSAASTKRLSKLTKTTTHPITVYPNTALCVVFEQAPEAAMSRLEMICHDSGNRYNMLALQTLAATKALIAFAQEDNIKAPARTTLNFGCRAGTLVKTQGPLFEVADIDNLTSLCADFACMMSTAPAEYIRWLMEVKNFVISSRWAKDQRSADDNERSSEDPGEAPDDPIVINIASRAVYATSVASVGLNIPKIRVMTNSWRRGKYQADLVESSHETLSHVVVRKLKPRKDLGVVGKFYTAVAQTYNGLIRERFEPSWINSQLTNLAKDIEDNWPHLITLYQKVKTFIAGQLAVPQYNSVVKMTGSKRLAHSLSTAAKNLDDSYGAAVMIQAASGIYQTSALYVAAVAGDPSMLTKCHYVASRREHKRWHDRRIFRFSHDAAKSSSDFRSYYVAFASMVSEPFAHETLGNHRGEPLCPGPLISEALVDAANRKKFDTYMDVIMGKLFRGGPHCENCGSARKSIGQCIVDAAFAYEVIRPTIANTDVPDFINEQAVDRAQVARASNLVFPDLNIGNITFNPETSENPLVPSEDDDLTIVIHYVIHTYGHVAATKVHDAYKEHLAINAKLLSEAKEFITRVPITAEDREEYAQLLEDEEYEADLV